MKSETLNKKGLTLKQAILLPFALIGIGIIIGMILFSGTMHNTGANILFSIIAFIILLIGVTEKSESFNIFIRVYYIGIGALILLPILRFYF